MVEEVKKSAVSEVFEDEKAGRLDFFHARTLAYSVAGEMERLEQLIQEWKTQAKGAGDAKRSRPALYAGVGLWILRKYAEAAEALKPLADHAEGQFFLGLCLTETGDYAGAVAALKKAEQAGQDKLTCAMAAAEAHRRAGRRDDALALIRTHQEAGEAEAEWHYQKGRCLEDANDYEGAMDSFERAVELNPQHAGALFRLAYWNDLRGNDEQAIDYYEKAAEIRPVNVNVLRNLGVLYEDQGLSEKAAELCEQILRDDPRDAKARLYYKDALAGINMVYDDSVERRRTRTAILLETPLSDFELSARSRACLEKMNIRSMGDLARLTEDELVETKNFGETSLAELRRLLQSKGLHFGMDREEGATPLDAPPPAAPVAVGVNARPIADLDLSVRCQKAMRTLGVKTLGDLLQLSERDLLQCQNFGQTSLAEVRRKLEAIGLSLKPAK